MRPHRDERLTSDNVRIWEPLQATPLLVFFTNKRTHVKTYKRHQDCHQAKILLTSPI